MEVVRLTFALMLKVTGSIPDWNAAINSGNQEIKPNLFSIWSLADCMKLFYIEQERCNKEKELEKSTESTLKKIKDKVELLLKFRSVVAEEHNKIDSQREANLLSLGKKEIVEESKKLKSMRNPSIDSDLLLSFIIKILQSDTTASQLIDSLENYYLRNLTLYNAMMVLQHIMSFVSSKKLRLDLVAWIMSIFKCTTSEPWHYSQLAASCGIHFLSILKSAFFGILKRILECLATTRNSQELACLLDALKWNYTISDCDDMKMCQLVPQLRGSNMTEFVFSLWGKELDEEKDSPRLLLNTFEFIVIKIVAEAIDNCRTNASLFSMPKDSVDINLSDSIVQLLGGIMKTVFAELKHAADEYEVAEGSNVKLFKDFLKEQSDKDTKQDTASKDYDKMVAMFKRNSVYSQVFCSRLLGLLYHLYILIQNNEQLKKTINVVMQQNDFTQLFRLLEVGSLQNKFLVLQLFPLLAKIDMKSLEATAGTFLNEKKAYLNGNLLNYLLDFIIERRKKLWLRKTEKIVVVEGSYFISKVAITCMRALLKHDSAMLKEIGKIAQVIIFGNKDNWMKLPNDYKDKQFIETILSITGGEFNSVHKGVRTADKHTVLCFKKNDDAGNYAIEFIPGLHTKALIHLADSSASADSDSLSVVNISQIVPVEERMDMEMLFGDIKSEVLSEVLVKAISTPLSENRLLASIQMKAIRILSEIIRQRKDFAVKPEVSRLILDEALKSATSLDKPSMVLELLLEEIRKQICQSKKHTLFALDNDSFNLQVLEEEIMLNYKKVSMSIPVLAHKLADKIYSFKFKFKEYQKDLQLNESTCDVLFVSQADVKMLPELVKYVKILVVETPLEQHSEISLPMVQISSQDMAKLKSKINELVKIDEQTEKDNKDIIKQFDSVQKNTQQEEVKKEKVADFYAKPLNIFTKKLALINKLLKSSNSEILKERNMLAEDFKSSYNSIYTEAKYNVLSAYQETLKKLKLFYIRELLLDLTITNPSILKEESFLKFLVIMQIEADYFSYGFKDKELSRKLTRVMDNFISANTNSIELFNDWLCGKLKQALKNNEMIQSGFRIDMSTDHLYLRFVYKFVCKLISVRPKELVTYNNIGRFMTKLIKLAIFAKNVPGTYRCFQLLNQILDSAEKLQNEINLTDFNKLLTSKCIAPISSCSFADKNCTTLMYKSLQELQLRINCLYQTSLQRFGEETLSNCTSNRKRMFMALEMMKDFPDMTKLCTYTWIEMNSKTIEKKLESLAEGSTPLYDTKYCVLVQDIDAIGFKLNEIDDLKLRYKVSTSKDSTHNVSKKSNKEKATIVNLNSFYFHLNIEAFVLFAFGLNEGERLGVAAKQKDVVMQEVTTLDQSRIRGIYSSSAHSLIMNEKYSSYGAGRSNGIFTSTYNYFVNLEDFNFSDIIDRVDYFTVFYDPEANAIFATGNDTNKILPPCKKLTNKEELKLSASNIKQISMSSTHILLLYNDNTVYASPESNAKSFGKFLRHPDSGFVKLQVDFTQIKKVLALESGTIILGIHKLSKKSLLYAYGKFDSALGLGDIKKCSSYLPLPFPDDTEILNVFGKQNRCAAITTNFELYTWGYSPTGALGHFIKEEFVIKRILVPTKVPIPDQYKPIDVSIGTDHMLVLAEYKEKDGCAVLGFGSNEKQQLGIQDVNAARSELTDFKGLFPYLVAAGDKCSFVACGSESKGIYHDKCVCQDHKEVAKELLYLSNTKEGLKCYCRQCKLPDIAMAIRNPIKEIEKRPWPILDSLQTKEPISNLETKCSLCKKTLDNEVIYVNATSEASETLCELCYIKTPRTFYINLYYRFASVSNFATKVLPKLSIKDFYDSLKCSLPIKITPIYALKWNQRIECDDIEFSLDKFMAEARTFEKKQDMIIVRKINDYLIENNTNIKSLSSINECKLNLKKKTGLTKFTKEVLERRVKTLIMLNKIIGKRIHIEYKTSDRNLYKHYYTKIKEYIATKLKDEYIKGGNLELPVDLSMKNFSIDRQKALLFRNSGAVDHRGEHSVYGQTWRQIKDSPACFYKDNNHCEYPFYILFTGEETITNREWIFRELLELMSEELQSSVLPLLIPTPNNKACYGEFKEKWWINPSAKQASYKEMFDFLGSLLGMAFRMSNIVPLNLPSIFWKKILNEPIDESDLKAIDLHCVQYLEDLINIDKKGVNETNFSAIYNLTFTTKLSDGSEVELKENGRNIQVTFGNRHEYSELVRKTRINEADEQIQLIMKGMFKVIPQPVLKVYTWQEVELRACGKPGFKLRRLKKATEYNSCNREDSHIQFLWEVLKKFTTEERSMYLRFTLGKSRMPLYLRNIRHRLTVLKCTKPDETLPVSNVSNLLRGTESRRPVRRYEDDED